MAVAVAELIDYYEGIDSSFFEYPSYPYLRSTASSISLQPEKTSSSQDQPLDTITMFAHTRTSSQNSSVIADSLSTSPAASILESPTSLHSSPTFTSTESFKYQGSTGNPQRLNSLPPFSMANMQSLVKTQGRTQSQHTRKTPRPWFVRRAYSQTAIDIESELAAKGIENMGLGMFEPRPRETVVSRQSTQGSVVLDGILEVMGTGR